MKNKLLKCPLESPHLRSHRPLEHKELDKHIHDAVSYRQSLFIGMMTPVANEKKRKLINSFKFRSAFALSRITLLHSGKYFSSCDFSHP